MKNEDTSYCKQSGIINMTDKAISYLFVQRYIVFAPQIMQYYFKDATTYTAQ